MEDFAAKRIESHDALSRVYEIYRTQGVDLRGRVLDVGNWRFDFTEYRDRFGTWPVEFSESES